MDSAWFLIGCIGFGWLVLWSIRDFDRPGGLFWPFDALWMRRGAASPEPGWRGRVKPTRARPSSSPASGPTSGAEPLAAPSLGLPVRPAGGAPAKPGWRENRAQRRRRVPSAP